MQFVNQSGFPAELVRTQLLYRDLMMATVIVKCSFEVTPSGTTLPVDDQLAISESDAETPYGTIDGDIVPIKAGCDLAVMGPAVAYPPGRPVESMDVSLRIGELRRALRVFGDRAWVPTGQSFKPSRPIPFTVMALDYTRAYGGFAVQHGELGGPLPENPDGCGYVVMPQHVAGVRLPNLEDPAAPIRAWSDRPQPAGFAPLPRHSALRGLRGVVVDLEGQRTSLLPEAFLFSHPGMHLQSYPAGQAVEIVGMTDDPPRWRFTLPDVRFALTLELGEARYTLALVPDTLCMLPRHGRFFVVARRAFVYEFKPERTRVVRVAPASAEPTPSPATTIVRERTAAKPTVAILPPDEPEKLPLPIDFARAMYPLTDIIETLPLCASG
jgi:hypothetical protein